MTRRLFWMLALVAALTTGCNGDPEDTEDTTAGGDTTVGDTSEADTTATDTSETDTSATDTSTTDTSETDTTATDTTATDTTETDTTIDSALMVYGAASEAVPPGGDYFDSTADGIPLFSFSRHTMRVTNESDASVTLNSMTLTPDTGVLEGEWTLVQTGVSDPTPLDISDVAVAAGESQDFDIYFFPFEYGMRTASVTITYDTSETYTFTITGRVRDNGVFFVENGATTFEHIYGDPAQDTLTGGMVVDSSGNAYVNSNVNQWLDNFSEDIVVTRFEDDGSLGWSKVWNEDFEQLSPDPGQNAESGGGAESIAMDGTDVFVIGRRSQSSSNSIFQSLILSVSAADGSLNWSKGWSPTTDDPPSVASDSSTAYAVDASLSDRLLITGEMAGDILLLSVAKDGSQVYFAVTIDVNTGTNDRGHTVAADGQGGAYIGGIGNARGLLLHITGVDGTSPAVNWVHELDMGIGSNINSIDVDAAGNAYLSLDRRGARTYFSAARVDRDGSLVWAKTFDEDNTGDNNNTYVVRVDGSDVYVGGRIALTPFDTQFGEGFLMKLAAADGAYQWATFYYTGKGAEEMAEHRVKGVAVYDGSLKVTAQSYTNSLNFEHYWGFWYTATDSGTADPPGDGSVRMSDYSLSPTDRTGDASMSDVADSTLHDIDATSIWTDPPSDVTLVPLRDREGSGGDGDTVLMEFTP